MKSHCLGVNIREYYLLLIWIQQDWRPDISANKEYVKQLLVESVKMELVVTLLRSVYNEYIAIEHLRETIYKCLYGGCNILVNVYLQIVGVLVASPTKLLPIFINREGMVLRSSVIPHLLHNRSLQNTPVVIFIRDL